MIVGDGMVNPAEMRRRVIPAEFLSAHLITVVIFTIFAAALLIGMSACQRASVASNTNVASNVTSNAAPGAKAAIQTKAVVLNVSDPGGSGWTSVGVMTAYAPSTRSFWWRPVRMIAEPEMLERYFERCKFELGGDFVVNFCVRGNEVVTTTTNEWATSLQQGLEKTQEKLRQDPGLVMGYRGPRDISFDLQHKAGADMNTLEGVAPTVVRSAKYVGSGWRLDVTCGCGNAMILLNRDYDFIDFKRE